MTKLAAALVLGAIVCLAGCQDSHGGDAQAAASTTTTTRAPMVGQPGYTYPSRATATTRARGVLGDGVCDELEQGSNSADCGEGRDAEVPASWVPCGQTGAYCPPGYDTPALAAYDPASGRRWTYADELGLRAAATGRPGAPRSPVELAQDPARDLRPLLAQRSRSRVGLPAGPAVSGLRRGPERRRRRRRGLRVRMPELTGSQADRVNAIVPG